MDDSERGQSTLLLMAVLGCAVAIVLALGPMARVVAGRAQARTAADAAALAGAAEGEAAARALAEANGAELRGYLTEGDEVLVKVAVDGVSAFGRARRVEPEPDSPLEAGSGSRSGLAPAMVAALAAAESLLGRPVPVVSGFRSRAQQEALWTNRARNPYPVAPPGQSKHERGLAVDVPRGFVAELLTVAREAGLCQPLPATDPVHFEAC